MKLQGIFISDYTETLIEPINKILNKENIKDPKIIDQIPNIFQTALDEYEMMIVELYINKNPFDLNNFQTKTSEHQKTIVDLNKAIFENMLSYLKFTRALFSKIKNHISEHKPELDTKNTLVISLFGLAIRKSTIISEMLINGFVDGAMVVWRSLYENVITALTLSKSELELSERYIEHSCLNDSRKIESYLKNYRDLGFRSLPNEELKNVELRKEEVKEKYGANFLKNDFGWAETLFEVRPTLRKLEEFNELNRYRPYYIICSEQIHANFNSLNEFKQRSSIFLSEILTPSYQPIKFVDPMQFTIGILHELNEEIIWNYSIKEEANINALLLLRIYERLQLSFQPIIKSNE